MDDRILLGLGRRLLPIPPLIWRRVLRHEGGADLSFMSPDHHRIRNHVVLELPRAGRPLTPEAVAAALDLPLDRTISMMDDLERHMTFLFRNEEGAVTWAYPVTVDETPHHITFSTGERINAA
jgi:hypothetical protein